MGMASEVRDLLGNNRRKSLIIASPVEDDKALRTGQCTQGVRAGAKAAAIASVSSAVPTLIAARTIPWAKVNLNYTASIAAFFITADKTILECARRNVHNKSFP